MPITFYPGPGTILICDFSTGFQPPEMVKVRPVVVISPRRRASTLVTVVPLSSLEPQPLDPWHHRLAPGAYPPARGPMWAKCDMVQTVGVHRLDRVMVKAGSSRTYHAFMMPSGELAAILKCVHAALGM